MICTYLVETIILCFLMACCFSFTFGWLTFLYIRKVRTEKLMRDIKFAALEDPYATNIYFSELRNKINDLDAYQRKIEKSIKVFTGTWRYISIIALVFVFTMIAIKEYRSTGDFAFHFGIGEISTLFIAACLIGLIYGSSFILRKEHSIIMKIRDIMEI